MLRRLLLPLLALLAAVFTGCVQSSIAQKPVLVAVEGSRAAATLGVLTTAELEVYWVGAGTPAETAGIQVGDVLVHVRRAHVQPGVATATVTFSRENRAAVLNAISEMVEMAQALTPEAERDLRPTVLVTLLRGGAPVELLVAPAYFNPHRLSNFPGLESIASDDLYF